MASITLQVIDGQQRDAYCPSMGQHTSIGDGLRIWRQRRRRSQLDLALDAGVSQRHLSFVESGRARPSRDMVLRLAEVLEVPLRDRNLLLGAAGFAPVFPEHRWNAPEFSTARVMVEAVLRGHEPCPALAVDRHWTLVAANRAVAPLLTGVAAHLLAAPVNVLRLSLHPEGLQPRIANLHDWRAHVLHRLEHEVALSADPVLAALLAELAGYPVPASHRPTAYAPGIAVPLQLDLADGRVSFLSTTTVFGTATDVTLAELTIETFLPADEATRAVMQRLVFPA